MTSTYQIACQLSESLAWNSDWIKITEKGAQAELRDLGAGMVGTLILTPTPGRRGHRALELPLALRLMSLGHYHGVMKEMTLS